MNKKQVDEIILNYQSKIFGFAMSKIREISEAEELAADTICEVYNSLTKAEHVANIDGYVYRIASNVYARYIEKKDNIFYTDIFEVNCSFREKGYESIENEEIYRNLRRKIGLLSQRQREIIYMKYYQNKSIDDISKVLDISSGTVKWHLKDARNNLKEKMIMVKNDNLSVNPIKFIGMGHSGTPGTSGDTKDMFDTRLKQNIAYTCYYEAKNIEQIANELEVPIAYVEDNLSKLVEWGYIDQVDNTKNPKYLTNMIIEDGRKSIEKISELNKEVAKYLCDNVFNKVFENFDNSVDNWGFQCANDDKNFIKYNLIMIILQHMFDADWSDWEKFAVKRPDGGYFIAHAYLSDDCTKIQASKYDICGYMNRQVFGQNEMLMQTYQCNCVYCNRDIDWRVNEYKDWQDLYNYLKVGCDKNKISIESYSNLCDKGYVVDEKIQVLVLNSKSENVEQAMEKHIKKYVHISEEILQQEKIYNNLYFELSKNEYPKHMEELVKYYNSNVFSSSTLIPYIIEELLKEGKLQELTDIQKKSTLSVVVI